jgi:carbonic anhydrase
MIDGNEYEMSNITESAGQYFNEHKSDFKKAATAIFIGCVDSRVIPEMLLGVTPGDMLTIRVPGALVPPQGLGESSVSAAIELALARSDTIRDLIVCGHTDCLMLKAIAEGIDGFEEPNLAHWANVADFVRAQANTRADLSTDPDGYRQALLVASVRRNLDALREIQIVAERERAGQLKLHGWYFDLEHGEIIVYDSATDSFSTATGEEAPQPSSATDKQKVPRKTLPKPRGIGKAATAGTGAVAATVAATNIPSSAPPSVEPASVEPVSVEPTSVEPETVAPGRVDVPKARPVQRVYASEVTPVSEETKAEVVEAGPQMPQNVVKAVNDPALEGLKDILTDLGRPSGRMKARRALDNIKSPQSWRNVARLVREVRDPQVRQALREIAFELKSPEARTEIRKILANLDSGQIEDLQNLSAEDIRSEFDNLIRNLRDDK